ncbi:MAG: aspartate/glutamate racemase family protein [Parasphingopyxis sp.]|nr:amino acid racemase [Sphingomonadales bacterium]
MTRPRHIGILMHSAEGALLCYRSAVFEGIRRLGAHNHPTITMSGRAMHHALDAWEAGDLPALRAIFAEDAEALRAAGAEFFVLPDNSAHLALETEGPPLPLPCLHIAEVVTEEAERRGFGRVAVLGTRWTMEGPVYAQAFERRGIDWAVPDAERREALHHIIMDELCLGDFKPRSIALYEQTIGEMAEQGCDAAALVCTEIPLIVSEENSALPVLDSTRLLASAAVEVALGDRRLPQWRGGPVE